MRFRSLARSLGILCLILLLADVAGAEPPAASSANGAEARPLRALLVTGGCCHDYPRQREILARGLQERLGDIQWTVVSYGDQRTGDLEVYQTADWAAGYDFVVHNECYGGVTDPAVIENIVAGHVQAQVPAIAVHCSMHSYRNAENADRWRAFLGVTSTFHERTHRSLTVVPEDKDHPIMAGFPDPWKTPNGELYIILRRWPQMHVLATAHSTEQDGDHPVVWINEHEGVRVFATTLGHHNVTMESPEWLDMTARGIRWALEKEETSSPAADEPAVAPGQER